MIRRLVVHNFQSWRSADLELAPVTMLVGRGDVGKSALVRAITYAATNQSGDLFIRDGANEAEVALLFDDGQGIVWRKERGKGGTYQLITDASVREFTKTGSQVPEAIVEASGLREIEIERGYSVAPQFTQQFDKPFLLEESGSRTARILGKLSRLDILVQAQVFCRRDRDASRAAINQLEEAAAQVREQLAALPDVSGLQRLFDEATVAQERALHSADQVQALRRLLWLQEASKAGRRAVKAFQALKLAIEVQGAVEVYRDLLQDRKQIEQQRQEAWEAATLMRISYEQACGDLLCKRCPYR